MPWNESKPMDERLKFITHLLDELLTCSACDECAYSHVWRNGDMIMWESRLTMDRVTPYDHYKVRRTLHRMTVAGDGPVV